MQIFKPITLNLIHLRNHLILFNDVNNNHTGQKKTCKYSLIGFLIPVSNKLKY